MSEKDTYFVKLTDTGRPGRVGWGECALFRGLSAEDTPQYESRLTEICSNIDSIDLNSIPESSIRFGLETAFRSLNSNDGFTIFNNSWSQGKGAIPINGLVWMGDFDTMMSRLEEKLSNNFTCIKIKIGGIDFDRELDLLRHIRESFNAGSLTIRLDANGAFTPREALHKIDAIARYDIHSIEQPIKAGQWKLMREICDNSSVPIALDEELIGNFDYDHRCFMLDAIQPAYIIIKPSLHGGFAIGDGWIKDAADRNINWWGTSALESNIGLNAIAQWIASKQITIPQGLGTGGLYTNNIPSPIYVKDGMLHYKANGIWDVSQL